MEPDTNILKPKDCSNGDSKFIQPKLSLNFAVGAHLLSSFFWVTLIVAEAGDKQ
jgi:hypothetical protein